jgi:hypothetical protein
MTIQEARDNFIGADRDVIAARGTASATFCNSHRELAYRDWIEAVRTFNKERRGEPVPD